MITHLIKFYEFGHKYLNSVDIIVFEKKRIYISSTFNAMSM